jgi:hypothetical protein
MPLLTSHQAKRLLLPTNLALLKSAVNELASNSRFLSAVALFSKDGTPIACDDGVKLGCASPEEAKVALTSISALTAAASSALTALWHEPVGAPVMCRLDTELATVVLRPVDKDGSLFVGGVILPSRHPVDYRNFTEIELMWQRETKRYVDFIIEILNSSEDA